MSAQPGGTYPEDVGILARMAAGDHQAVGELYDRHARTIYALAWRIVGDRGEAEDVVQEVFSQAWRQASRYDPARASVAGWLLMLTRARAIDRLRARRSGRLTQPGDQGLTEPPDLLPDQEARAITAEAAAGVRRALEMLPEPQRVPIELAYFSGLTQVDIAERLREPLGTIKTRMRTGLQKLRTALQAGEPND